MRAVQTLKKKKKFFTVLKSPHVNKTAQEQFNFNITIKKLTFNYFKFNRFLIIFKKIKQNVFSDIYIKIKFNIDNQNRETLLKKTLNSKKYRPKNTKKHLTKQLKILQLHGSVKFLVWIAQLVEQRTENPCDGSSILSLNNLNEKLPMECISNHKKRTNIKKIFCNRKQKKNM